MRAVRKQIAGYWTFWVTLFSQQESNFGWALFRIAIGICLLWSLGSIGISGLIDVLWLNPPDGGYRSLSHVHILMIDVGPPSPKLVYTLYTIAVLSTISVTVGLGKRLSTFIALQSYLSLSFLNTQCIGSDEALLTNALWLLFLCDASSTLSLHAKLQHGRWVHEAPIHVWARYLVVFQLLVVYAFAGINKTNTDWVPWGHLDALYLALQDPDWQRFNMRWVAYVYPLTQIGSAVTWTFEFFSWLILPLLYIRYTAGRGGRVRRFLSRCDYRKPFLVLGLLLHGGIFATLNVGPFSFVSMAYYLCFWRAEELKAIFRSLKNRITMDNPYSWANP